MTPPNPTTKSWPLPVAAPFHLEATVRILQRRSTNRVDTWEDDRYRRLLATPDGMLLVEVINAGTVDEPDVRFSILNCKPTTAARKFVATTLRRMLGLDVDTAPVQRWAEGVPKLRATALALRGIRPPRFPTLFETFGRIIPFQQISLDAGEAIAGRMVAMFGAEVEVAGRRWFAFPQPEVIAQADIAALRSVGLSRTKAESLIHLAGLIISGKLTEELIEALSTADALEALRKMPGIGPWTATVVLLRGFGRMEVFPPNDTGVARGLGALLDLEPGPIKADTIERFGEHRGYLYFYSLAAQIHGRGLIAAAPKLR